MIIGPACFPRLIVSLKFNSCWGVLCIDVYLIAASLMIDYSKRLASVRVKFYLRFLVIEIGPCFSAVNSTPYLRTSYWMGRSHVCGVVLILHSAKVFGGKVLGRVYAAKRLSHARWLVTNRMSPIHWAWKTVPFWSGFGLMTWPKKNLMSLLSPWNSLSSLRRSRAWSMCNRRKTVMTFMVMRTVTKSCIFSGLL